MYKNSKRYALSTIYQKALDIGYRVEKGFVHYHDVVDHDHYGNRRSGYSVMDLTTGYYVLGCYDENFDHLWSLDDVINFLQQEYDKRHKKW